MGVAGRRSILCGACPLPRPSALYFICMVGACLQGGMGAHGWVVRCFQPSVQSPSWSWLRIVDRVFNKGRRPAELAGYFTPTRPGGHRFLRPIAQFLSSLAYSLNRGFWVRKHHNACVRIFPRAFEVTWSSRLLNKLHACLRHRKHTELFLKCFSLNKSDKDWQEKKKYLQFLCTVD